MPQDTALVLLQEGIAAAKAGNKALARLLLLEATEQDPHSELGWLWLAGVAESPQEALDCLQRVLAINPANPHALKGLEWAKAQAARAAPPRPPPLRPAASADASQAVEKSPAQAARGVVLVVDDSATVRKLVSITLEKQGYRVIAAADGLEALGALSDRLPDLVLLDITMPRMDGYQVCKIVKGNPETSHIPVIMLSGKDGFFDKVRGRMAGSTDYITKPFEPEALVQAVEKYVRRPARKT